MVLSGDADLSWEETGFFRRLIPPWNNKLTVPGSLSQSIRAGSMSVNEDKRETSNGLSRVSHLTSRPALFNLMVMVVYLELWQ